MHKNLKFFVKALSAQLIENNIIIKDDWIIDHICYRVSTEEQYINLKNSFCEDNKLLIESTVGGRLISSFKLKEPLDILGHKVSVLELPAPKNGKITPEGYEHIEIVCSESFKELISLYGHLNLDKKGMTKEINPELEIEFKDCSIKFHHQTLESVIEYEKSLD
jgi:predicted metalloenzyme YecM